MRGIAGRILAEIPKVFLQGLLEKFLEEFQETFKRNTWRILGKIPEDFLEVNTEVA